MNCLNCSWSFLSLNVTDFFKTVLQLKEDEDYSKYEDDEFQRFRGPNLYWYCNTYQVRRGLKAIKANLTGDNIKFCFLKSKDQDNKTIVRYKLIFRDFGKGIPSIVRKFFSTSPHYCQFDQFLKGYCQIIIRSKMDNFEGISYDVLTGTDDVPCPNIKDTGTEFEIMFTQGRER